MIKKNFLASITKAEFDSALADFNARLTTFEAGINSKIDSQVTSYLDRNGIWSAKSQVINNGMYLIHASSGGVSVGQSMPELATKHYAWTSWGTGGTIGLGSNNWPHGTVCTLTKSGLVVVYYDYNFLKTQCAWSSNQSFTGGGSESQCRAAIARASYGNNLEFYMQTAGSQEYNNTIVSNPVSFTSQYYDTAKYYVGFACNFMQGTAMLFGNNGDNLMTRSNFNYNKGQFGNTTYTATMNSACNYSPSNVSPTYTLSPADTVGRPWAAGITQVLVY